jgi:BTB/POZ domain
MSDANVIIQSCDLVNFRVHQRALAMSSPFFDDMFSLPQPQPSDEDVVDGLPVVRLSEDAEVLNSLISMLYPIPSVLPNSYDKALTLLATSQKYDMAGAQSRIRAEIQSKIFPVLTGPETFRSYAISSSGKLPSEIGKLARLTLDFPMTFEYLCDELPSFEGRALRDLVGFRKRCRDNLVSCFESFLRLDQPFNIWIRCDDGKYSYSASSDAASPSWLKQLFQKHLNESREAFSNPFFDPRNIRGEYLSALQAHINSYSCISCTKVHTLNGETFCKALEDRLTQALSEVRTSFIFWRNYGILYTPLT